MDNLLAEPTEELDPGELETELEPTEGEQLPVEGDEAPEGTASETAEEAASEPTVKIILDGKEEEIPLSEAANGYMRQADYSRKTDEIARQRVAVEAAQAHVQQELAQRANQLSALSQALYTELVGDQQALNALTDNPTAYLQKQQEMSRKGALLTQVQQAMEAQREAQAQEQVKAQTAAAQRSEAELVRAIPEWADPAKKVAIQRDIAKTLTDAGYTASELAGLTDHRALLVARDAMLWRKHQALQGKKAPPAIKKPVVGSNGKPDSSQLARAKERYKARPDSIEALADMGGAMGSL